jgi:hypothetical protein
VSLTSDSQLPFERVAYGPRQFVLLWVAGSLWYGVGDTATTYLMTTGATGIREVNPLVRGLLDLFGLPGLVGLKVAIILALAAGAMAAVRRGWTYVSFSQPAALLVTGLVATTNNAALLLAV